MVTKRIELYGDGIGAVEYINHMGDDRTIVNSARVSFGVEKNELDNRDHKLIRFLIKHRHTSVFEHCQGSFRFTVPLFVRSQHHRHRTWSYNEISRRYTDVNIKFYEPNKFRTQHKSNRQASNENDLVNPIVTCPITAGILRADEIVQQHHSDSLKLYENLMEAGVCREQARGILPQNLYTEYYGSVNLSNLMKFIDLRTHEGAQWEIQKVGEALLEMASELWPVAVEAFRENKND